ncbi:hypothetical protein EVA_14867 [gut metagenome]|uniref:Uncharacterized protein n=1 Tax=gut metagenome TaxID=749906 RepID=J9G5F7_9ZZZZ
MKSGISKYRALHGFHQRTKSHTAKLRYTRCRRDDIHTVLPARPFVFRLQAVR